MSKKNIYSILLLTLIVLFGSSIAFISCRGNQSSDEVVVMDDSTYAGSESCRECHANFYELWSPSHHGKAMQPIDSVFIHNEVTPQPEPEKIQANSYQMIFQVDSIFCLEYEPGSETPKKLPVVWALGGKNVYYFLTPWEGGRLQTLPLAYDVNTNKWYNNPASGVRHFITPDLDDEAVDWQHSLYTFNTTCHSCHVSQLEKNYNAENNTYHTIWKEPGINCESCHGPSLKHAITMRQAEKDGVHLEKDEWNIITTSTFTPDQHIASCTPCHAKMTPITASYPPGEPLYNHFNMITLDNPDFYPDGRDLGENYTYASWQMNECWPESDMHCVTCHTSSGRNRFAGHENANNACISCHERQGNDFEGHTHHSTKDVTCISCHMPKTMFAHMARSDHSFRPPMPAATIEFGSPNACNICHEDKTPQWANKHVTEWKGKDYQKPTLYYGGLIKAARDEHDFSREDEMLKLIKRDEPNEMFVTAMIRLLGGRETEGKDEVLIYAAKHSSSALVRSAAIDALRNIISPEVKEALLNACKDSMRIVRVSAGATLAHFPDNYFTDEEKKIRDKGFNNFKASLTANPDQWSSYYNLGNFKFGRGDYSEAIAAYQKANELEPEAISPYVNASLAYSYEQNYTAAEESLKKALAYRPNDGAANVNLGLLMGEMGRYAEAKAAYRKALDTDPELITAAYNLSVVLATDPTSKDSISQILKYAKQAYQLAPIDPKYGYTYAFYLNQAGKSREAVKIAEDLVDHNPNYIDGYLFMENIFMQAGNKKAVVSMYNKALKHQDISAQVKQNIEGRKRYFEQD